jgi:hypothetical protein
MNINETSLLADVADGAYYGAAKGTYLGLSLVCLLIGHDSIKGIIEATSRYLGNPPRWVIDKNDCFYRGFKNLSICTEEPLFKNQFMFVTTVVGSASIVGMVAGGVSAAVRSVFNRPHAA